MSEEAATSRQTGPVQEKAPLSMARSLAWVTLVLILILSGLLATFISNAARSTLLVKQQEFSNLLADNLNHQIYRRFTLPTLVGFGRIALRQPAQYQRLDMLVQSVIHGLHVQDLRIYDHSNMVTYATDEAVLWREDLASEAVKKALVDSDAATFDLVSTVPYWKAFFSPALAQDSFHLRIIYPLRIENRLNSSEEEGPVMGVLEFTRDVTDDVRSVVRFQWSIIGVTLLSSLLLFSLLILFIRRAQNVLDRRAKEEQRLLLELHQHEKLAGMGRVVAGIAHEIRNPLGIIRSSAELLLGRKAAAEDPMAAKILQAMYDESKRLSQTVNDFLDYARPRRPAQDAVTPYAVLEQALAFLEPELARLNIELNLKKADQEKNLKVTGDKDLLYRALYNVLSNAIQAVGQNGHVDVLLLRADLPTGGKGLEIRVRDYGPGFNADQPLDRFLDPFFTTKDDGSGLGLPIVDSIVSSHGGKLRLQNAPPGENPGAVVSIFLPL